MDAIRCSRPWREAVRKGDLDEAKNSKPSWPKRRDDETDTEEACGARRDGRGEEVDHDEELEEATEEAKSRADDDSDEEDEDAEDLDEAESDDDDLEEAGMFGGKKAAPFTSAVKKQKPSPREAAIKAARASPRAPSSPVGSYVKPAKRVGKSSMVAKPKKLSMREANYDSGETGLAELRAENASCVNVCAPARQGERLSEALRIRSSADRAKKLLRESNLRRAFAALIDSLLGSR